MTLHSRCSHANTFTARRACETGAFARPATAATLAPSVVRPASREARPATAASYGMTAAQFAAFNEKMAAAKTARQARAAASR